MKSFVIGLLLLVSFIVSNQAESSEEKDYRIVTFREGVREAMEADGDWKTCGNYFAAVETTSGKLVHFAFEKDSNDHVSTILSFATLNRIVVSIDGKATIPTVTVRGGKRNARFAIKMNVEDYKVGLPCLTAGRKM